MHYENADRAFGFARDLCETSFLSATPERLPHDQDHPNRASVLVTDTFTDGDSRVWLVTAERVS